MREVVPARGERKLVTILFADLTGYTALASSHDPEDVYTFLRPTMASLQRIAEDFGGTVPQVMGDGFMAVFGVPVAHEDDPERAVRGALAIRDHVREVNVTGEGLPFPEVHAGINSGEVMVAPTDELAGFQVIGDTVNVASRLADLASGGHVLVDERTRNGTSDAITYGPRTLRRAKGKEEPLATYEALAVRAPPPRPRKGRLAAAGFVDRKDALARLEAEVRAATQARRSRVLLLSGEPGVGKSRLAEEFARRLRRGSVISGRCVPFGQRLPLAALAEAVGGAIGVAPGMDREAVEASVARLVRKAGRRGEDALALARDLRLLLGIERPPRRPESIPDAVRAARAVIEGMARERPVTVVVDDLHWADPDLLRVIQSAQASPWRGPVLFLCLSRPERLAQTLPSLDLEALDEGGTRELAQEVLGSGMPQAFLEGLLARAGGNPLFLEESIGMLMEAGALVEEDGRWRLVHPEQLGRVPSTIRLLIAARLDGLPLGEKHVLQDASVAGEVVWDRLLEHISRSARAALSALEARDLLRRRRHSLVPSAVEYEFKHVLIREAAYESLPRAERASRHLQIAQWLMGEAGLADEPVALLAHHYERAWELSRSRTGPPPSQETGRLAVTYLRRWADETLAYQARSAESLYRRGLRVADEMAAAVDPAERARLLTGRAEALEEMGHSRDAMAHAAEAHDWARRSGEGEVLARVLLARGRIEQSRPLLQRALTLFEQVEDLRGQGWAHLRISETWAAEDYGQELKYLRRAYRLFVRSGDRWGRTMVAQDLAYLLSVVGDREFHRWYEESRRLMKDEGDLRSRAALLRTWGYYAHYRGEHREAIRVMREARPLAAEAGDRYVEADTLLIESMATSVLGPPEEAEPLAREAVRLGRELESDRVVALGLLAAARAALRAGRQGLSARRLRSAVRLLQPPTRLDILDAHLVTAQMQLDRGSWDDVPAEADQLLAAVLANGWKLWEPTAPLLVGRAHLGAGRLDRSLVDLARAVHVARSVDASGMLALARAVRDQAAIMAGRVPRRAAVPRDPDPEVAAVLVENRGLLALRADHAAEAEQSFAEAVLRWRHLGTSAWVARALALQAEAARRNDDRHRASRMRLRASGVLDSLKTPASNRDSVLRPLRG